MRHLPNIRRIAKWVWTYTRQHKIPKVKVRQFNYYSKKHIDAAFAKYKTDDALTEWYTPEEIKEKYGMTRVAIRSHVYRNNIPSKKEHGQTTTSLQRKSTARYSTQNFTSICPRRQPKMILQNIIPCRKP